MADGAAPTGPGRVSTLELFFDLVFVFTITQVALIVEHHPSWSTVAQALVELAVIYWMYGGFAWLTNTLGSATARQRVVLLLGMGAFFVVSLAVPRAFDADGVAFGWAYLVLTVVHLAGFLIGGVDGAAAAMRRIGRTNLLAAALIVVAGYAGSPWHWPLFVGAVAVQWAPPLVSRSNRAFSIDVTHFAERHGLMIIIVLGESLVSVALAASEQKVTIGLVAGVLCGLAASGAMWWCYFAGEDEAAAAAFERTDPTQRGSAALFGYDLPHLFMLAGVVGVAAGSRLSLPHLTSATSREAALLIAGGVAVYLVALAAFRIGLRFGEPGSRLVAAGAVVLTAPIGTAAGAAQELLAIAAILVVMLVAEHRWTARGAAPVGDPAG